MIKRQISFLFEDPGFCIDVFCTIAEPVRYYNRDTESGAWYSSTPDWHENGSLIREDLIFEVIANGVVCALDGNGNFEGKKPFVPFYQFRQSLVQSVYAQHPHLQDHEALREKLLSLPDARETVGHGWYVGNVNLYFAEHVRILLVLAYTVVKLPFSLRMIKAAFYAIDEELEDAARNMGASGLTTFLRVKLPIILPSVLAVFALNFNALFTEYDMSATFASSYGTSYAMVIQAMCAEEGLYGYNVNASGRRCASTVFIMLVSGVILYLVYGVGARDLGERLEARERRRRRVAKLTGLFKKEPAAVAAEAEEAAVAAAVPDEPGEKL